MAHVGWRFWNSVDKTTGCWLWTGSLDRYGYGHTTWGRGKHQKAHRVAWRMTYGEFPPSDMTLDHLCRVRACVNPAHLEVVTRAENVRRGLRGGSGTHCQRGHEFATHRMPWRPEGQNWCRTCYQAARRRYEDRKRQKAA